jgi:hypothetical protein
MGLGHGADVLDEGPLGVVQGVRHAGHAIAS